MSRPATHALVAATAAALLAGACAAETSPTGHSTPPNATVAARPEPLPVLVDYSPTLSDAGALLYLAAHPGVDLRAVTLAGTGESRCEAAVPNTLALLALAGETDVPVACGRTDPLGPGQQWPAEWRDAADELAPLELSIGEAGTAGAASDASAVDLIVSTAASTDGLVVVALGPVTNLAEAIDAHPGLAEDVAMTYSMGGAIGVPGNAPGQAEWNFAVDPVAADVLVQSDLALTLVPLDATDHVPADHGLYRRMNDPQANPAERAVLALWTAAVPWQNQMYLWDELTAMVAVDPSLAPAGPAHIEVITSGAQAGRTVASSDGHEVLVAGRPDRRRAETEFLAGLAGADTP